MHICILEQIRNTRMLDANLAKNSTHAWHHKMCGACFLVASPLSCISKRPLQVRKASQAPQQRLVSSAKWTD